ncbi:MAG: hypothetical protein WBA66_16670, partial [Xanthobacteraceae bacterium]
MGNNNDTPDPTADAASAPETRRKREPATIELAASDVTDAPLADDDRPSEPPPPESPPPESPPRASEAAPS